MPSGRHYGPDQAGGLCTECMTPMVAALPELTMHPMCEPAAVEAAKRLQVTLTRRAREAVESDA